MTPEIVKRAFEARQKAVNEIRSLAEGAADREFTAEETQTETRAHEEIVRLDAVIKDGLDSMANGDKLAEAVHALEARSGTPAVETAEESLVEAEQRALRAFIAGDEKALEFHAPTAEQRAVMAKGAAGTGGNLVPTTMYDSIVKSLRDLSSVMQAGATVVNTAGGEDIAVPTSNAFPSAAIVAENGAFGASDSTFGQVLLKAFKYGFISQASVELLADSAFSAEAYVAQVGAEALSHGINTDFIVGAGSTSAPQGILGTNSATAGHTLAVKGVITFDDVMDWYHSVQRQYRQNGAWIVDDSFVLAVRKLKDTTNQYLWQPGVSAGAPDTILGRPVLTDVAVPDFGATTVAKMGAFGDFKRGYLVRLAGGVRVERSTEYAFANDLVSWKFALRADGRIVDTNAIKILANPV